MKNTTSYRKIWEDAYKEKNLKWYTDGKTNLYVTENTQPPSFKRGRTMKKKGGSSSI